MNWLGFIKAKSATVALSSAVVWLGACNPAPPMTKVNLGASLTKKLTVTASSTTAVAGQEITLLASGGVPPYIFSIIAGSGEMLVDPLGTFKAPDTTAITLIRAEDPAGGSGTIAITTVVPLRLSETIHHMSPEEEFTLRIKGGSPTTTVTLSDETLGTLSCKTDCKETVFTATDDLGGYATKLVTLTVTDGLGLTATSSVHINSDPELYPSTLTLAPSTSFNLLPRYGIPPYTLSITSDGSEGATLDGYQITTGATTGDILVGMVDSAGTTAESLITVSNSMVFSGLATIDTVTSTSVKLNWTNQAGETVYLIYDVTSGTPSYVASVLPPTADYVVSGLTPGTNYTFRVRSVTTLGEIDTNVSDVSTTTLP